MINSFDLLLEITVRFSQAMYSVSENAGVVQVSLILSNPSSTVVRMELSTADRSANGKYNNVHYYTTNIYEFHLYNVCLDLFL